MQKPLHKLSILIPTFNEGKTLAILLNKIQEVILINDIEKEIIIINDCSTDNTKEIIDNYRINHSDINLIYIYN